jgi:hypothetical protein
MIEWELISKKEFKDMIDLLTWNSASSNLGYTLYYNEGIPILKNDHFETEWFKNRKGIAKVIIGSKEE